mmetsp:Transcript_36202/g.56709  ORF Transcript_36202/g.56709 Transcript_36202/m.56709 type:complete len:129 (-) Transcript_36202:1573-1959(-)
MSTFQPKLGVLDRGNGFRDLSYVGDEPCPANVVMLDLSKAEVVSAPTRTSIELTPTIHVEDDEGKFMNHHCSPNCIVDGEKKAVISCRVVNPGESLTFDYNVSETLMSDPFVCNCCGKWIRGRTAPKP